MNDTPEKETPETAEAVGENAPETAEASEKPEKNEKTEKKDKRAVKLLEKQLEDANKALEQAKKEKEELNDTYLRMLAEYDNFRKRVTREKETLYADGKADAVAELLTVLDNLERAAATDAVSADAESILEGVGKILSQASEVFEKLGVTEIPAAGEPFDPELHNAVMHEENENFGENTVSEVFQKGYRLGDKVIRHSVVKVAN